MGPRGARCWCHSKGLKLYHSMNYESPPRSGPLSSSAIPVASKCPLKKICFHHMQKLTGFFKMGINGKTREAECRVI